MTYETSLNNRRNADFDNFASLRDGVHAFHAFHAFHAIGSPFYSLN